MFYWGAFRGYNLYIVEPWNGMAWYFVTLPGVDARCVRGEAEDYRGALELARQIVVAEVKNEQNPRGRR